MDELVVFLRARLAEDEERARAATPGPWTTMWTSTDNPNNERTTPIVVGGRATHTRTGKRILASLPLVCGPLKDGNANAEHITRHNPARVLTEINAHHRILDLCETARLLSEDDPDSGRYLATLQEVLSMLAASYDQHPDYRDEWRPHRP